jgi:hypothetical protein
MSNAVASNLRAEVHVNPLMTFHNVGKFGVNVGPSLYTPTTIPTTSFSANGGGTTQFNAQPPDIKTAVDRNVLIKWKVQIDFSALAGVSGYCIDIGSYDAPRAFPISQCINSTGVTLNNAAVTLNVAQVLNALLRCNLGNEILSRDLSFAPCSLDEFQNYNDPYTDYHLLPVPTPAALQGVPNLMGMSADPLAAYSYNMGKFSPNRGGYPIIVNSNTQGAQGSAQTASVQFSTMEPLWVSPFGAYSEDFSLIGLTTLTISISFLPNLQRMWSHNGNSTIGPQSTNGANPNYVPSNLSANASTLTNMVVTFLANPVLHITYMTPPLAVSIPPVVLYPYSQVDQYNTTFAQMAPFSTVANQASSSIQLNSIPNRILVWVERRQQDKSVYTSDTFLRLERVSVTFDNQSGQLAQATSEDLWFESRRNGLQLTWNQWQGTVGSVFILDLCKNLALTKPSEAPSITANKQLQIFVDITNINGEVVVPTLWVAIISSGIITIESGTTIQQSSVLTESDVLNAVAQPARSTMEISESFYGGKRSRFGRWLNKAHKWATETKPLTKALNIIGPLAGPDYRENPVFQLGERAAEQMGYGYAGGSYAGGSYAGGRMVDKNALKRRALELEFDEELDYDEGY